MISKFSCLLAVAALFVVGCGRSPVTSPTTTTLTVRVSAEAFVTVDASTGRFGQIAQTAVRFPNLRIGDTVTVTASNNVETVNRTVVVVEDADVLLTIHPPRP